MVANTQNKYVSNKTTPLNAPSLDEPQIYISTFDFIMHIFYFMIM